VSHRIVLRSAHEQGLPVRVGRAPPARGPSEIELLAALYADPEIRRILDRHCVPAVTVTGPIWKRFPAPQPLTAGLATELYEGCGLSTHQIELLTGAPAAVRSALRASGVQLRPAGGRSPFMRCRHKARDNPRASQQKLVVGILESVPGAPRPTWRALAGAWPPRPQQAAVEVRGPATTPPAPRAQRPVAPDRRPPSRHRPPRPPSRAARCRQTSSALPSPPGR